jgi:membrane protein DedA with SNARE-associated domain
MFEAIKPILASAIRHGLTVLAGVAGFSAADGQIDAVAGYAAAVVLFLASIAWSAITRKKSEAK